MKKIGLLAVVFVLGAVLSAYAMPFPGGVRSTEIVLPKGDIQPAGNGPVTKIDPMGQLGLNNIKISGEGGREFLAFVYNKLSFKNQDKNAGAYRTALDIVNKALGIAGVTAKVSTQNGAKAMEKYVSLLAKKYEKADTGKMSWDLYNQIEASKLAKIISQRANGATKITGTDLAGAIGEYISNVNYNPPNTTIENTKKDNNGAKKENVDAAWNRVNDIISAVSSKIRTEYVKKYGEEKAQEAAKSGMLGSKVATYFKVPEEVIRKAATFGSYSIFKPQAKRIPRISLLLTTGEKVTSDNLSALKEAGYTITGSFGNYISVEAPITTLINLDTGLQNFDFVTSATLPPEVINN